jgi:hypothetical protein
MKIIKEGIKAVKTTYSGECLICGCIFETDDIDPDVYTHHNNLLKDPNFVSYTTERKCPTLGCNNIVVLKTVEKHYES